MTEDRVPPLLRERVYRAGESWHGDEGVAEEIWFAEQGLLVLEQPVQQQYVEIALLGCDAGLAMPAQGGWRVRSLLDGRGHALPLALALSLCPDLLLQTQQHTMTAMARWAYCTRHHPWQQRLAACLLWMHQSCAAVSVGWPALGLPGRARVSPAQWHGALADLERAGAVRLQDAAVHVQDPAALAARSCPCHSTWHAGGALP